MWWWWSSTMHHRCRTSQSPCSRECVQQFCFRYVCQPPLNAPQHNTRQKSEKQTAVICNEIPLRKFCRLNTIFSERYFPDFIPLKLDIHLRNQTPVSLFILLQHRKAVYLTHWLVLLLRNCLQNGQCRHRSLIPKSALWSKLFAGNKFVTTHRSRSTLSIWFSSISTIADNHPKISPNKWHYLSPHKTQSNSRGFLDHAEGNTLGSTES